MVSFQSVILNLQMNNLAVCKARLSHARPDASLRLSM